MKKKFIIIMLFSCSDEQEETRCYTPGDLRQVISENDRFPELPCIPKNQAKSLLEGACERLEVEDGPKENRESNTVKCCYEFKVKKIENCIE